MLWTKDVEQTFFRWALEHVPPEKLFYVTENGEYVAYWPKGYKGPKKVLQSRNAFIGSFTENWFKELLIPFAERQKLKVFTNVISPSIGLSRQSPADVAICVSETPIASPQEILVVFEVKMSIVWNWRYDPFTGKLECIGDFTTHTGNPSLLRSDSMLKAIGKSINLRVYGREGAHIPIIVIGNTPISKSYYKKVDALRRSGVIQRFVSLNPKPSDTCKLDLDIKTTSGNGFIRVDSIDELYKILEQELHSHKIFFSSMMEISELGKIIEVAATEPTYEKKALKFLNLLERYAQ